MVDSSKRLSMPPVKTYISNLDNSILREIPNGSNISQTDIWLTKNHFEFSTDTTNIQDRISSDTDFRGLALPKNVGSITTAIQRNIYSTKFDVECSIQVYFFFDKHGKLVKHLILPKYTYL